MKDHPNVIRFLHYQRITRPPYGFLIICERPANCQYLSRVLNEKGGFFAEHKVKKYMKKLLDAFLEMERKNIVYNDLSLDNILYDYDRDNIKFFDFSKTKEHKSGNLYHKCHGK